MQHVSLSHRAAFGVCHRPAQPGVLRPASSIVAAPQSFADPTTQHRSSNGVRTRRYGSRGKFYFAALLALTVVLCSCAGIVSEKSDPASLTIMTGSLAAGQVGVPYHQQLTAVGGTGPYIWTISEGSLPPGMTLTSSGVLSGVPSAPGQFSFVISVTDMNQAASSVRVGT